MTKAKRKRLIYNLVTFGLVIAAFIILQNMIAAKAISRSLKGQLVPICAWIVMAVSLNLVIGFSGELSLGHAGFMSVGAYTGAVVSGWLLNGFDMQDPTLRLVIAILCGGVIAGIVGALIGIPVLRLRGDYLAIVTLAFGEIIRSLVNVLYVGTADGKLYFSFLNKKNAGKRHPAGGRRQRGGQGQTGLHLHGRFRAGAGHADHRPEPGSFPRRPRNPGHPGQPDRS